MPKANGITKTYSFDKEIVRMIEELCKIERRTQTSLLEYLVYTFYNEKSTSNSK